jgi:hypothetical protein
MNWTVSLRKDCKNLEAPYEARIVVKKYRISMKLIAVSLLGRYLELTPPLAVVVALRVPVGTGLILTLISALKELVK